VTLDLSDTSALEGTQREDLITYQIPEVGEANLVLNIPAKAVDSSKSASACQYKTKAQWLINRSYMGPDGISHEMAVWEDIRDNEYVTTHFDTAQAYFELEITQEEYIREIQRMFGAVGTTTDNTIAGRDDENLAASIFIEVQFITFDITHIDSTRTVDNLTIEVKRNSAKSLSEAIGCDFANVAIAAGTDMAQEYTYQVKDKAATRDNLRNIDIPITLDGVSGLSAECSGEVFMTLEMQRPNGSWVELWSDQHEYYMTENNEDINLRVVKNGDFKTLELEVTPEDFERKVQVTQASKAQEFEYPVAIKYKSGSGAILAENQFNLKIKGNGEPSECADAAMTFKSKARDVTMKFPTVDVNGYAASNGGHFSIPEALKVDITSQRDCRPVFRLEVYDP
jgi:hypothetical protein